MNPQLARVQRQLFWLELALLAASVLLWQARQGVDAASLVMVEAIADADDQREEAERLRSRLDEAMDHFNDGQTGDEPGPDPG